MKLKINLEPEEFCCESSLLQDALDTLGYIYKQKVDNYASIVILCQEDLTESIIKSLNHICAFSDIDLNIDYINFDKSDYFNEYGVVLIVDDGQLILSIEKAYCGDGNYKLFDLDYVYISDECCDELIERNIKTEMDMFCITDECKEYDEEESECDGDCENCELHDDEFDDDEENCINLYEMVSDIVGDIIADKYNR